MLKASFKKYTLHFKSPGGTSRGVLSEKDSWFLIVRDEAEPGITGIGECSLLKGLSIDDRPDFELKIQQVCKNINNYPGMDLTDYPSIRFGLETALADLQSGGNKLLFKSLFTRGFDSIEINGLVWMGDFEFMKRQIREKIEADYTCIKLKIGAINFDQELDLIKCIRKEYSAKNIGIRVDANGAFSPEKALEKLARLAEYDLHSIEQPIRQGQWDQMAKLCRISPVPIALDEELIGISDKTQKQKLLESIHPQYIILKPGLIGGFKASEEWIELAGQAKTGWWITSALESNIGLNAIAQWAFTLGNKLPQGLGTGQIFTNNFKSPLTISTGKLMYDPSLKWDISKLATRRSPPHI
jgi:L-alanine-DL-glutamate epimerase-like enolase superfamily enzyme